MLALLDERTGSLAEVRPGRHGVLRIGAHIPPGPLAADDATAWRVLLLADLVSRVAELQGIQALTAVVFAASVPDQPADSERAADALGVHPPAARTSLARAEASLGGPFDVHAAADSAAKPGAAGNGSGAGDQGIIVRCGAVRLEAGALGASGDVLAVRFALMSAPYGQDVALDATAAADAFDWITNSRHLVAQWAESPSRPIPQDTASALRAAFDELDTSLAIRLLRDLADDASAAPGAKFEAFAFADRILGLDLAREIGRSPA